MSKSKRLKPISPQLILERMMFENPWWVNGKIDEPFDGL
jgi:hypothetical protein